MRTSTRMVVLGGRKLWTPAALGSSLALWLDAEDRASITLNGSTVSQWNDKSGNGRNASQGVAANQPLYEPTGFNGRPAVFFDADFLDLASTALFNSGNADLGMFFAYQPTLTTNYGTIFANLSSGNLQLMLGVSLAYLTPYGIWNNAELNLSNAAYVQNALMSVSITRTGGAFTAWTHGVKQNTVANTNSVYTESNTQSIWTFGANTIGGERGRFRLPEFIAVNGTLSTTDRQRLEGYLAHKWGLIANLPSDHPFKFTPPIA